MQRSFSLLATVLVGTLAVPAWADEATLSESAQKTLAKTQKSLVTVKTNVQMTVEGLGRELQKKEMQAESTGTVVAPNGLTVVALQAISPAVQVDGAGTNVQAKAEVTDIKLIRHDGQEVTAKVVLRDEELGLAFLLPTPGKETTWPHLEMTKGAEPRLLDELIVPHRFNKVLNRQAGVDLLRVRAVLREPRTYISPTAASGNAQGCPVFEREGQLVGILTSRTADGASAPVILPSTEVGELVKQALVSSDGKEVP